FQKALLASQSEAKTAKADLAKSRGDLAASEKNLAVTKVALVQTAAKLASASKSLLKSEAARVLAAKAFQAEQLAHQGVQAELKQAARKLALAAVEPTQKALARANLALAGKQAQLIASQNLLAESLIARKELRADLAGERELHRATADLLALSLQSLIHVKKDAEEKVQSLAKTKAGLQKAQ